MTDDVKLSDELVRNIVEASGQQYSTGSQYDVDTSGIYVKMKEYDSDGMLKQEFRYSVSEEAIKQYVYDDNWLNEQRHKNKRKSLLFRVLLAFMIVITMFGMLLCVCVTKILNV